MANDFKFGSKAITDLYFGNKAVLQVYFGSKLIWPVNVQRTLVMDTSGYVLMKYEPSRDIVANTIGIFTTGTGTNGRAVYILNNDGILIGKSASTETTDYIEKYSLTGTLRTTTFDPPFTFKAGKIYWIQYYFENCQAAPDAYYENEDGTDFKRLACNNLGNPVDLSGYNYVGTIFESNMQMAALLTTVLQLNANDAFMCKRRAEWPIDGLSTQDLYARASSYPNTLYKKTVDHTGLASNKELPTIAELSDMSENQIIVVGIDNGQNGLVYVYQRTATSIPTISEGCSDMNIGTSASNVASFLLTMNSENKGCTFSSNQNTFDYPCQYTPKHDGTIYVRTDQGRLRFSSNTDIVSSVPSDAQAGDLYLKAHDADFPGSTRYGGESSIVVYLGNDQWQDWKGLDVEITLSDNTKIKMFNSVNLSDLCTDIRDTLWNSIYTRVAQNPSKLDLSSQPTLNTMKHYLEINGNEEF